MPRRADPLGGFGELEPAARRLDGLLRPADALGHRGLGHEERLRDLRGGQTRRRRAASAPAATAPTEPGWQQRNRRVSGVVVVGHLDDRRHGSSATTLSSRRRRALSLRHSSTSRREATVVSQARGLSGTPSVGHCSRRGEERLLDRVLAGVELAVAPDERAEDLRRQLAQQVLDRSARHGTVRRTPPAGRRAPGGPRSVRG